MVVCDWYHWYPKQVKSLESTKKNASLLSPAQKRPWQWLSPLVTASTRAVAATFLPWILHDMKTWTKHEQNMQCRNAMPCHAICIICPYAPCTPKSTGFHQASAEGGQCLQLAAADERLVFRSSSGDGGIEESGDVWRCLEMSGVWRWSCDGSRNIRAQVLEVGRAIKSPIPVCLINPLNLSCGKTIPTYSQHYHG